MLLLNSDSSFFLRELSRKIGKTPVYVKKELANLMALGLVLESKRGNQLLFRINKDSHIFPEIKKLFVKTDLFPVLLRESLRDDSIVFAFVFGSFADCSEHSDSDIDVFVVGSISEQKLSVLLQKAEKKTGREVNHILWSKKLFEKRVKKHHLLKQIAKKPVIMIVGGEHELRKALGKN